VTWPRLSALLAASWALLTLGLCEAFAWRVVLPLSAGLALGALGVVYLRAMMAQEMSEKDEADK
jgi:hypothetical protein